MQKTKLQKQKLFTRNKDKALVYLDLRCALEPEVLVSNENEHSVHGGNDFGGCFMSGQVQSDSWEDYGAWLSQNCTDKYYFDKTDNMHIYSEAADLQRNNALNIFGAGYGEDTHTVGDTYLYIKAIAQTAGGDGNKNGKFPYIFNAFGGSNMGRVLGNTNVYYAVGKQGTLLGSLYGGSTLRAFGGGNMATVPEQFEITEPEIKIPEDYLRIYAQGRSVIVESSDDCILPCHGIAGSLIGMWKIQRGINTFSNLQTGIYIIGGKKIVVK